MRLLRSFAACAGALLLAGCASLTPAPDTRMTSGRIGVRVDAFEARPAQSFSAAFELAGSSTQGELRLLTPLGTELALARWRAGAATLRDGQSERAFDSVDDLAAAVFGETMPLAALPAWIAGRPWAGAPHETAAGGFRQLGWEVDLAALAERRIAARRAAPPAVAVRIVLDP